MCEFQDSQRLFHSFKNDDFASQNPVREGCMLGDLSSISVLSLARSVRSLVNRDTLPP
jgi:hypothetical protein